MWRNPRHFNRMQNANLRHWVYLLLANVIAMALEKKFNDKGEINPNYAATIKQLCEENDRKFFEDKLSEIGEYFKERQKEGWPYIKTGHDLNVECQVAPLVRHCLKYLDGELALA